MLAKGSDAVFLDEWTTRNLKHARCFLWFGGCYSLIVWCEMQNKTNLPLCFATGGYGLLKLEGSLHSFFGEHVATTTFCGWIPQVVV